MMKYLFLDDVRQPTDAANYIYPVTDRVMYRKNNWEVVRSYDEFTNWILKNGLPDVISFDHDLEDAHYSFQGDYDSQGMERTGYHCAKWLVEFCMHEKLPLPEYYVHSMNPVGAENIETYLENYKKYENTSDRSGSPSH